jgi:hypothetical protein
MINSEPIHERLKNETNPNRHKGGEIMTPLEIESAAAAAKRDSEFFIGCHWEEEGKCLVYQFSSGMGADQYKFLKETQGSSFRMVVQIHNAQLSSLREYHPEPPN